MEPLTRFEEKFATCPHGNVRVYCPQCLGDRLRAEADAKRAEEEKDRSKALRQTVKSQSEALAAAYARINTLERRLRAERRLRLAQPRKRGLFGRLVNGPR
jgi:uncharacterized Zn finger protein (UPF0148 family)